MAAHAASACIPLNPFFDGQALAWHDYDRLLHQPACRELQPLLCRWWIAEMDDVWKRISAIGVGRACPDPPDDLGGEFARLYIGDRFGHDWPLVIRHQA